MCGRQRWKTRRFIECFHSFLDYTKAYQDNGVFRHANGILCMNSGIFWIQCVIVLFRRSIDVRCLLEFRSECDVNRSALSAIDLTQAYYVDESSFLSLVLHPGARRHRCWSSSPEDHPVVVGIDWSGAQSGWSPAFSHFDRRVICCGVGGAWRVACGATLKCATHESPEQQTRII